MRVCVCVCAWPYTVNVFFQYCVLLRAPKKSNLVGFAMEDRESGDCTSEDCTGDGDGEYGDCTGDREHGECAVEVGECSRVKRGCEATASA